MPRLRITGRGAAELPGYGVGDAEHRLEKELAAAFPGATLRIESVRRTDPEPRIVESFVLEYVITAVVGVEEEDEEKARRAAFARARAALAGTRFERIRWERAVPERETGGRGGA